MACVACAVLSNHQRDAGRGQPSTRRPGSALWTLLMLVPPFPRDLDASRAPLSADRWPRLHRAQGASVPGCRSTAMIRNAPKCWPKSMAEVGRG